MGGEVAVVDSLISACEVGRDPASFEATFEKREHPLKSVSATTGIRERSFFIGHPSSESASAAFIQLFSPSSARLNRAASVDDRAVWTER
jgi:hypothetical protein